MLGISGWDWLTLSLYLIGITCLGIFLEALLASVMSSCDAFMVSSSGLWTLNLYRPYFTPSLPQAQLDRFYNCIHTPIGENEPHLEPFTLPDNVTPTTPRKLINTADMEIPMPTAVGVGGFLFFCLMVVALIGFVYWLAQVRT
jgi:hypothetical protein